MVFNIRQGASEPVLKLRLVDDGKNDKSSFNDALENSTITFSMYNNETGEPFILNSECFLTNRIKKYDQTTDEYYIIYRFSEEDTSVAGKFEGMVTIQFLDTDQNPTTKLILPLKEKLFINIF